MALGVELGKKDTSKDIVRIVSNTQVSNQADDNVDYSKPVTDGPMKHGFDYSLVIPSSSGHQPVLLSPQ